MEPHDLDTYSSIVQWTHSDHSNAAAEIIANNSSSNDHPTEDEVYDEDTGGGPVHDDDVIEEEYLVGEEIIPTNEIHAISNSLDQSAAAQNLIYMAQEGSVVARGDLIEAQVEQAEIGDYNNDDHQEYFECQVTEEVITDDWVQRQGEERIEIIIDSIETAQAEQEVGDVSHVDDIDIDVSLPTVQDEYTASRPYPCDFCSRRFRKKANLINHMVAHQQERPHVCHLCGARYIRKSDLMQHLKIHAFIPDEDHDHDQEIQEEEEVEEEKKPSRYAPRRSGGGKTSLTASASSSSTIRGGLGKSKPTAIASVSGFIKGEVTPNKRHLMDDDALPPASTGHSEILQDEEDGNDAPEEPFPIIDPRRPFVCQKCGLAFAREKAMLSHTKSHVLETQLECKQCGETFYDAALLREHEYSHSRSSRAAVYPDDDDDPGIPRRGRASTKNTFQDDFEDFDDEDRDQSYVNDERAARRQEQEDEEEDDDDGDEDYRGEGYGVHYYCDHCGMSFVQSGLLRQHVKTAHPRHSQNLDTSDPSDLHHSLSYLPPSKCLLCGEERDNDELLQNHVQAAHKEELNEATCGVCGKQCRDVKAMEKHCWERHQGRGSGSGGGGGVGGRGAGGGSGTTGKAICQICHKIFINKARLKRHLLSHRKRTVQCDLCMEEFPDGRSLMNHRHSHTTGQAKKFPCKECGKSFGSRSSQQIHVRMHTG